MTLDKKNPKTISLRELSREIYSEATRLHEVTTESVKATGKYPTSAIMQTPKEDLEVDSESDDRACY
jgi:hypothetical protein